MYIESFEHIKTKQKFDPIIVNNCKRTCDKLLLNLNLSRMNLTQNFTSAHPNGSTRCSLINQPHQTTCNKTHTCIFQPKPVT